MASSEPWHTARQWAVVALWLACSVTAVSAQDGRWARVTVAGVQAFEQGDYAEAVQQFQAALPLADAGSLAPSLIKLQRQISVLSLVLAVTVRYSQTPFSAKFGYKSIQKRPCELS